MHCCSLAIFFMCTVRGKLISSLQAIRSFSQLSTTVRFRHFFRLNEEFVPLLWRHGPCSSLSTIPLQSHPGVSTPFLTPPPPYN
jgi:hypothetical protein